MEDQATVQTIPTLANLAGALAKAQAEFSPVSKNCSNPHFKNRYADLSAILAATRPALSKHGLAFTQTTLPAAGDAVGVRTMLLHASGELLSSDLYLPAGRGPNPAQAFGSALSYARRYAAAALLGIAAEDEDDGNGIPAPSNGNGQRQAAPAPAPAPNKAAPADDQPSQAQIKALYGIAKANGWDAKGTASVILGMPVESLNDLTKAEASRVIDAMKDKEAKMKAAAAAEPPATENPIMPLSEFRGKVLTLRREEKDMDKSDDPTVRGRVEMMRQELYYIAQAGGELYKAELKQPSSELDELPF